MKHQHLLSCICTLLIATATMHAETKDSVFYVNNNGWAEVFCYAWNSDGNNGWPGVQMNAIDYTLNEVSAPILAFGTTEAYDHCIFNNGAGGEGNQTEDLDWNSMSYYMNGEWYAALDLGGKPGSLADTCYLINAAGWDLCYSYAWQKTGGTGNEEKAWPGRKMKKMDYQIKGFDVYAYIYEPIWRFCIFNNGTGEQSADLMCSNGRYFFNNEWQGKWYTREEAENMTSVTPSGDPNPTQKFYYTTTDGQTITPTGDIAAFGGATVLSNTYTDGQGCIVFDRDLCFLGKGAFKDCATLETASIPNSVYTIAYEAFAKCTSLNKVSVGTSVISIGMLAFKGCTSLEQVSIPSSVTIIGDSAFSDCSNLQNVTCYALEPPFPGKIVFKNVPVAGCNLNVPYFSQDLYKAADQWKDFHVQAYNPPAATQLIYYTTTDGEIAEPYSADAFGGAYMLSNTYTGGQGMIIFDRDLTTIDSLAYSQCTTLLTISLPASVETLGAAAFVGCSSLTSIQIAAGNSHYKNIGDAVYSIDGKTVVAVPAGSTATERVLSAEVNHLESMAMSGYNALTSLTAWATEPATLGSEVWAGLNCAGIPLYVPYVSLDLYKAAAQWKEFDVQSIASTVPTANQKICYTTTDAQILDLPASAGFTGGNLIGNIYRNGVGELVFDNDVTGTTPATFSGLTKLKSILLPASITGLGTATLCGCTALTKIEVAVGNTTFDSRDNCNAIIHTSSNTLWYGCQSTVIPASVVQIADNAFRGHSEMTTLSLPASITALGNDALNGCSNMSAVTCYAEVPPTTGTDALKDVATPSHTLYVPYLSMHLYRAADQWKEFFVQPITGTEPEANCVLHYTSGNGEVIEPCVSANFGGANVLVNTYWEGVGEIVFDQAPTELSGYTSIFGAELTSIELPATIKTLGTNAFFMASFETITLPEGLETIGWSALSNCPNLKSLHIPASVTDIQAWALGHNPAMESMTVAAGNTIYDSRNNCNAIVETGSNTLLFGCKNTTIPSSITRIGDHAFYPNASILNMTIPASVEHIGTFAFAGCVGLVSMTSESGVPPTLDADVWEGVDCAHVDLYVPYSAINLYRNAAQWKEFHILAIPGTEPSADEAQIAVAPCPDAADGYCGEALTWTLDTNSGVLTIEGTGAMYDYPRDTCVPWHDIRGAIRQVVLPAGLNHVGDNAFFGCEALEQIYVPAGASVGLQAFGHCPELN